jgi:hypothetical protein
MTWRPRRILATNGPEAMNTIIKTGDFQSSSLVPQFAHLPTDHDHPRKVTSLPQFAQNHAILPSTSFRWRPSPIRLQCYHTADRRVPIRVRRRTPCAPPDTPISVRRIACSTHNSLRRIPPSRLTVTGSRTCPMKREANNTAGWPVWPGAGSQFPSKRRCP